MHCIDETPIGIVVDLLLADVHRLPYAALGMEREIVARGVRRSGRDSRRSGCSLGRCSRAGGKREHAAKQRGCEQMLVPHDHQTFPST